LIEIKDTYHPDACAVPVEPGCSLGTHPFDTHHDAVWPVPTRHVWERKAKPPVYSLSGGFAVSTLPLPHQLRQLGDVRRNPPRFILGEQFRDESFAGMLKQSYQVQKFKPQEGSPSRRCS
jgi:hypothetical protein